MTGLVGKAFRYDGTGPASDPKRPHHCVIVTVSEATGDLWFVPICSTHQNCDKTCVIKKGDWGLLTKESYAGYYGAKKKGLKGFKASVEAKTIELVDVPESVFSRIIKGIDVTDDAPDWFLEDIAKLK